MIEAFGRKIRRCLARLFERTEAVAGSSTDGPAVSSEVRSTVEGGNLVLLHMKKGLLFKSNRTGARIWQGLQDRRPLLRIAEELSREFGVPPDVVKRDVDGFIADLESHGLLARRS